MQNNLNTTKGKQDCLCQGHWVLPSFPLHFNQTLNRWLRLSLESIWHLKHCIWFPHDPQNKAVFDVNIKASWKVVVPTFLLPFSHHLREGLISLWYLLVDDRAESLFQAILWDESKAIMQIPAEYWIYLSWFYGFHLGKKQELFQIILTLSSFKRGRCNYFIQSVLLSIQLFVANSCGSYGKDLI